MAITELVNLNYKKSKKREAREIAMFHIAILELIPRAPEAISIRQLMNKLISNSQEEISDLEDANYIKRIQRALNQLCGKYAQIEIEQKGRTKVYSWAAMAEPLMFPSLDSNTALVLTMASHYLNPILPVHSIEALKRLFMRAKSTLAKNSTLSGKVDWVSIWRDKVAVSQPGLPRQLPKINHLVENNIYEALLFEKVVKITYQAWGREEANEHIISPQGLFVRGQSIYIYAVNHKKIEDSDPILYLLHRVQIATFVDEKFHKIPRFNVHSHLELYSFGVPLDKQKKTVQLKIKLDEAALKTVREQPLSKDQKVVSVSDGWTTITATVNYNLDLKQWIRSHSHHAEVLEPIELRDDFKNSIQKMIEMYK